MKAVKAIFLDTNILVYANAETAPMHKAALSAIEENYQAQRPIWISRQVLREYLVIMTRPQAFAEPLPKATVIERIKYFQNKFNVADDNAAVTEQLLHLLKNYDFGGKHIHDADIVATMKVYDIPRLLTHNIKDFNLFGSAIEM
jgi:predicted nucleic acid-binding protein